MNHTSRVWVFQRVIGYTLFGFETNSVFLSGLTFSYNNVQLKKARVSSHNSLLEKNLWASQMVSISSFLGLFYLRPTVR